MHKIGGSVPNNWFSFYKVKSKSSDTSNVIPRRAGQTQVKGSHAAKNTSSSLLLFPRASENCSAAGAGAAFKEHLTPELQPRGTSQCFTQLVLASSALQEGWHQPRGRQGGQLDLGGALDTLSSSAKSWCSDRSSSRIVL